MTSSFRIFLLLISFLCFVGAVVLGYKEFVFIQNAGKTSGRIVDYVEICSGSGVDDCSTSPRIEFTTLTGKNIIFTNKLSSSTTAGTTTRADTALGSEVAILYDKNDPHNARIDSLMNRWFLPFICTFFGLCLLFIAKVGNPRRSKYV